MRNIRWRPVLLMSISGVVFGVLTIFAVISGYEGWVALIVIAGIGKFMAFLVPDAPIRNAFAAGFLAGLLAIWTQGAFLPLYFENNPTYQQIEIPFGLSARTYTVMFAPFGALVAGFLASAIAWPVSRVISRWRKAAP